MDSTKPTYATFPFEWTLKSTFYQIQYRKAFNINEIDEVFCSIINAKGNEINFPELTVLLGFNLQDLAEIDVFKIYLKGLTEYNLIVVNEKEQKIQLTEFGQEAIQSKLKYKYYFASTELVENQTATGETFDFSFKNVFDIENRLSHGREFKEQILKNPELKQKLQFQLFGNDIYKGEIVELYEGEPRISYKTISLQTKITAFDNSLELSIFKSDANKPEVQFLIGLPQNAEFKSKLLRKGMYHHILSVKALITKQDIETYIDLWNWRELADNPKLDWYDNTIFELFRENGDGGIWSIVSEKAPIESIKSVIEKYADYWNWTTLTERFDDEFLKGQIKNFDWDFEELSCKETGLVTSLLLNSNLKERDWDWNYLSKNLPDKFIDEHIEDFAWDFYVITESKNEVFKNTFIKYRDNLETLIAKNWNWKFISEEINLNFLHKNISALASKLDWHTVLNRFFNNEEITTKCLNDESFKTLLKQHLPEDFIVARQKYLWTLSLIDFFENLNLIQWESKIYINGFDTNENVEWSKSLFQKYHNRITTECGFLNVSRQLSDESLLYDFSDFAWNWEGISQNKKLINNTGFVENAFVGKFSFSNNLGWSEILSQSTFHVSFWNRHLDAFYEVTDSEEHYAFWNLLTQNEHIDFIFQNYHFPWDWSFITKISTAETILDSLETEKLAEKWNWEIATKKLDSKTILDNLEKLARYIDWKFLINEVFTVENELSMDLQLPRIAACLTVINSDKRKDIWKYITAKFSFETLFPIVHATIQLDVFDWDWESISNHKHFPTDIRTLNQFKERINWSAFSSSNAIQQKFNPSNWENIEEWFLNIEHYLQQFENNWDWQVLSKNKNINYSRSLLQKYKTKNWNWDYLTEFGGFLSKSKKDNEQYLEQLVNQFRKIKFEILSKRKDIEIDSVLILSSKDKNWDWQVLSENEKAEISNELILELKDKNWNWQALSKRKRIEFCNEMLLQLLEKDWDWNYLSENENLDFNAEFIEKTKAKSWNWESISRHKSFLPTVEILTLTKDFDLDWQYLSQHSALNPTKEILAKFENKWHWQSITKNPQINFSNIDFIDRFAKNWDWYFICESGKLPLNNQILNQFKEQLKWDLISANTNIDFTIEIIQKFYELWNWTKLKNNKRIEELKLLAHIISAIDNDPILYFIDKITEQNSRWNECVFHFTNIDNAIKIIKEGKIKSRITAKQLSNSSGILTQKTRKDPEKFARFYFRTSTPTQFYNEGLYVNNFDEKYRALGYPKCPIMIYFKVSLQEILFANRDLNNTFLANGNMQRNRTKYGMLKNMTSFFYYEELFSSDIEKYKEHSQQELMFEFDVSILNLQSLEVICQDNHVKDVLVRMLNVDSNNFEINIDNTLYENANDRPVVQFIEDQVKITSNNKQKGYFEIQFDNFIPLIDSGDVFKIETLTGIIFFKSSLVFPNDFQDFKLSFVEEIEYIKQKWILGTKKEFIYNVEHENNSHKREYFQY